MRTVQGAGAWPGKAEGTLIWLAAELRPQPGAVADRAGEVLRFRAELARALADLEIWSEQQQTVAARVLLQGYREALLEDAWHQRVCAVIDEDGTPAARAAVQVAEQVGAVMGRSGALQERAGQLAVAARWLSERLSPQPVPPPLPEDAILASQNLSPLAVLDRRHPALLGGPEPVVRGGPPLVWGVPGLGPHLHGRRVALNGPEVTLDLPDPRWWEQDGDSLNGIPICHLNGNVDAIERMARRLGRKPVAMVSRLEDLAAVPLFASGVAAIALDLNRLGPAPRLKHPGMRRLLEEAARAAKEASVPLLAGGEPASKHPDSWFALGCTALYGPASSRGGQRTHALRRRKESGL